jgi:hypothetical protein
MCDLYKTSYLITARFQGYENRSVVCDNIQFERDATAFAELLNNRSNGKPDGHPYLIYEMWVKYTYFGIFSRKVLIKEYISLDDKQK